MQRINELNALKLDALKKYEEISNDRNKGGLTNLNHHEKVDQQFFNRFVAKC